MAQATYIGPPPFEMQEALEHLQTYLRKPPPLPPLVNLAFVHYQFEAIHPFLDGNGRIGRLLLPLLLCRWGVLSRPCLYLSAYFEHNRDEYYRLLLAVSRRGDWEGWLSFFLRGVAEQSRETMGRAEKLVALREDLRARLSHLRASGTAYGLVDRLFASPAVSVAMVAAALRITRRAAQQNINRLVDLGILAEVTGRQRSRVYVCPSIIQIVDADYAPPRRQRVDHVVSQ